MNYVDMVGSGTQSMVLVGFLVFVGVALLLCVFAGPDRDEIAEFYTANHSFSPLQNGLALSGDYISAITLLSTTGTIALHGYDGLTVILSIALALGVLLVLSWPLRNAGRYTLGDIFSLRAPGSAARIAAAAATLCVSMPYLMIQLVSAGSTTATLMGLGGVGTQQICTAIIGILMVVYTVLGGMKGTSLVQILKMVLVFGTMSLLALLVLHRFGWNVGRLVSEAAANSGHAADYLSSGGYMGKDGEGRLSMLSFQVALVLGAGCTPHMLMRVNAAPDAATARKASRISLTVVAVFCVVIGILGLGASAVVGGKAISAADPRGGSALLQLAGSIEGDTTGIAGSLLFTVVACAIFVTVLAVVAGITLAAAAALAHDVHAQAVKRGRLSQGREVRSVRWAILAVGVAGIACAVGTQGYNVQFLTSFAMASAASAVLPAVVYSLFWSRFNRAGLLWTVYGGLVCTIGLYAFSPAISGYPTSLFPTVDFHWFPLQNPAVISVPTAFVLGWMATLRDRRPVRGGEGDPVVTDARVLAGIGAE